MASASPRLSWLEPGEAFPPVEAAWRDGDPAPGLLAAGGVLDVESLRRAYASGIFPWFSEGQPVLWWSPDPRMVLEVGKFRLHRSLRKSLTKFLADPHCEIRVDSAFSDVISACAQKPREGQAGTWILPRMVDAYVDMHHAGYAHSIETWVHDELVGGLYCINIGGAVFGESMFAHKTDASKIALAALVAFCRTNGIDAIDCQQETQHLASLGAAPVSRQNFIIQVSGNITKQAPSWRFETVYWDEILTASVPTST